MTTSYSSNIGLALPVQGELSGTWGDTVNNGITGYVDIAVAGTLTLNGDGAVTLANTNGTAAASNIGATTAQYAILKITGTTTAKVITAPSVSKTYTVINDSSNPVTVKASGQTGVTVAAGEKALVAFNGTDYALVAGSAADGVSTISFGTTGLTPSTATSGAVSVAGTLNVANGGTGATTLTANNVLLGNGTSALQVVAPGTSGNVLTSNGTTWASSAPAAQVYPGAGIAVSTGTAWGTSKTSPSGAIVGDTDTQTLTNKTLGSGTVLGAAVTGGDFLLTRTMFQDTGWDYYDSTTTAALDYVNGSVQRWAPTASSSPTLSISNWPPSGAMGELFIEGINLGAAGTITWPTINWVTSTGATTTTFGSNGVTLQSSGTDWILLWTRDGGTTVFGKFVR